MSSRSVFTGAAMALLALAAPFSAQAAQVVNINDDPNPTAAGNALIITLANITDNSASKPYVITMDPGTYDLGDTRLQLKPFVDIQGSGQGNTIIQGNGNPTVGDLNNGVLKGANSMEIRDVRIVCVGGSGRNAIALYNALSSPTLRNVTITSSGGASNWGIRNAGSNPLIEDSTITVSGGSNSYGIVNSSSTATRPTIRRTVISASGATNSFGIYNDQAGLPVEVRDNKITVSATSQSAGFYYDASGTGAGATTVVDTAISATGATTNYGISFTALASDSLTVDNSQVAASGGTSSYGISLLNAGLTVRQSSISGATRSIKTLVNSPKIGLSQLAGPFEPSGLTACAGVYDQNLVFYAGPACP
jgi:hypothetical protein